MSATDLPTPDSSTPDAVAPAPRAKRHGRLTSAQSMSTFLLACALGGALLSLLWHAFAKLPVYTVGADGSAVTDERGLTEFVSTDAVYTIIGLAAGLVIGVIAWRLYGRQGTHVVVLALAGAGAAGLACWLLGVGIGPSDFPSRISAAQPGNQVPIDFQLRSWSAVLVWLFASIAPVLFWSAIARDDGQAVWHRRKRRHPAPQPDEPDAS